MRWRGQERLPAHARDALELGPKERVLAAARGEGTAWVAATEHALVGTGWRVWWADVAQAQWFAEESVLALDPVPGAFASRRVHLSEPGRLPEAVHERVMASIVVSRRVAVPGGWVQVLGRRDFTGGLVWQSVPDARVDPGDVRVAQAVDAALAGLRAEMGPV